jgi:hypothetical protein
LRPASARLVSFDLIPTHGRETGEIPTKWASFTWSPDAYWANGTAPDNAGTGFQNGMVSAPNVAYNDGRPVLAFGRNTPFELVSFYLTSALRNGLEVTVTGYMRGVEVDSETFTVNESAPTLETFDWHVDRVTLHGSGKGDGDIFVLDNLTTMPLSGSSPNFAQAGAAAPEAPTWIMMLVGLAGLGFTGRATSHGWRLHPQFVSDLVKTQKSA